MVPLKLIIVDRNPIHILAVKRIFDGEPNVAWIMGAIRTLHYYDCLITPGNSFGIMDGGFDAVVKEMFGDIEARVQHMIENDAYGELNVGDAALVIPEAGRPHICYAPTMRVPMQITRTDNIYVAMRAALAAIHDHNNLETISESAPSDYIQTVAVPLLGAGAGRVPAEEAARQMKLAWDGMKTRRAPITTWAQADAIQAAIGIGLGGDPDNY